MLINKIATNCITFMVDPSSINRQKGTKNIQVHEQRYDNSIFSGLW